jgi:hypothetical protein
MSSFLDLPGCRVDRLRRAADLADAGAVAERWLDDMGQEVCIRAVTIISSRFNSMTACGLFGASIFADVADFKIVMEILWVFGEAACQSLSNCSPYRRTRSLSRPKTGKQKCRSTLSVPPRDCRSRGSRIAQGLLRWIL